MHSDVLPELSQGPVLEVQTESPGLSSEEVEQYITVPMENNLLDGVMGVWNVRSQSTPGLSTVDLYFEPGTTTFHARQLVTERRHERILATGCQQAAPPHPTIVLDEPGVDDRAELAHA